MTPEEIGKRLSEAADRALPEDSGNASARALAAILRDLRPVRPLAPSWVYILALLAVFAAVAAFSAFGLGMAGLHALNWPQRALIFPALLACAWLSAVACARQMSPAAGTNLGPAALILSALLFSAVFGLAFQGYSARNLVREGLPCLVAGICVAIPSGLGAALILRRGFVLDWDSAGLAAGVLSGLAGLGMLELHCVNLKAIHVMVWHVAVVMLSGAFGFGAGLAADAVRRYRVQPSS